MKFKERWSKLYRAEDTVRLLYPELSLSEVYSFFSDKVVNAEDGEEILVKLEEANKKIIEQNFDEYMAEIRAKRDQILKDTDYTQIADSPFDSFDKKEYREYRQYLRDIPMLYEQKQIVELKVMSFEDWQENKPIYKKVRR